jgi:hypothetical protein
MSGGRGGHKVSENCALLGYYAASSCNFLPSFEKTYLSHLQGFLNLEERVLAIYYRRFGTTYLSHLQGFLIPDERVAVTSYGRFGRGRLFRNVCKELSLLSA